MQLMRFKTATGDTWCPDESDEDDQPPLVDLPALNITTPPDEGKPITGTVM
jgi:hypothetical protein